MKAAKTRKNIVSKLTIDNWVHALEIIKTEVARKTDKVATSARSEEFKESSTLTTTFPNTCTVTFSFKNICAKSKRIAVEVHTVRAENEEFDMEQQEAGATALTSPQYA